MSNTIKEFMVAINSKFNAQGFNQLQLQTQKLKTSMTEIADKIAPLKGVVVGSLGMGAAIHEAIKFEDSALGIAKQMQGARDESGNLTKAYYDQVEASKKLSLTSPISADEINKIKEAGFRMNVATADIDDFTKTAIKASTAFEMDPGAVSDSLAKILGVFEQDISKMDELGDSLNYLDDNTKATASQIIEVTTRTAGMAHQFGLSMANTAALGATFVDLGDSSEIASTSVNALLTNIATAPSNKGMVNGLKDLGLNAEQFRKQAMNDLPTALDSLFSRINKLDKTKKIDVLTTMFGREYADNIAKISGAQDRLQEIFKLANDEKAKGSMEREYQARLHSTSAQLQLFKNNVTVAAIAIGEALLPPLVEISKQLAPMIQGFADWAKAHPELIKGVATLGIGLVGLSVGLRSASWVLGGFSGVLKVAKFAFDALKLAFATNPLGLFLLATMSVIYYWDNIVKLFQTAWDWIKKIFGFADSAPEIKVKYQGISSQLPSGYAGMTIPTPNMSIGSNLTPQQSATMNNSTTNNQAQNTTVNNDVKINVQSTDPASAGREVGGYVNKVNRDSINQSLSGFRS